MFIKADGEFRPLEVMMHELFGSPELNLTSANEHVDDVERKIRVVKECTRAIIWSMSFNFIPELIRIHIVLFVGKMLHCFPSNGGLPLYKPKRIMLGETIDYNSVAMGCGHYCQIHEKNQP